MGTVEGAAPPVFRHVPAPTCAELQELVQQIAARIGKVLEGGPLDDLIGHSITYRIAVGPRAGQKLFTLQTVPAREPEPEQQGDGRGAANAAGFHCMRVWTSSRTSARSWNDCAAM